MKSKFSNSVIDINPHRSHGHLAQTSSYSSGAQTHAPRKKALTEKEINEMKILNTFVKTNDDFFDFDPNDLGQKSDVDEDDVKEKRVKTGEKDFMEFTKRQKPSGKSNEI